MTSSLTGLCTSCVYGFRLPGEPKGSQVSLGGQPAYYSAKPPTAVAGDKSKTIVVFPDAFGITIPNTQIIADTLSERLGIDVYVHDMFHRNPPLTSDMIMPLMKQAGEPFPIWEQLKTHLVLISALPGVIANRRGVLNDRADKLIQALKDEKGYTDIGVVGYCMGGAVALHVATTKLVKSAAIAHPGPITLGEVRNLQVPTSWICAEEDKFFSKSRQAECENILAGKAEEVLSEFQAYKGTVHGFALRPNQDRPEIKNAFEDATEQIITWMNKTL